jgi:uncharacterized membrane protein
MTQSTQHPSSPTSSRGSDSTRRLAGLVLGVATLTMGLIAGFFFDWAVAIMPALAEADDQTFVSVMQELITTINESPLFLLAFSGALVSTGAAAILLFAGGAHTAGRWVAAAFVLYLIACLITFSVHFPLHDTLAAVEDTAPRTELAAARDDFEQPWVAGHLARTAAVIVALSFLCRAVWLAPRERGVPSGPVRSGVLA